MDMNQKPQPEDFFGDDSLARDPEIAPSVADELTPEIAAEIRRLEARMADLLEQQVTTDTTDVPVGAMDGDEIQKLTERIAQLRAQQEKALAATADMDVEGSQG